MAKKTLTAKIREYMTKYPDAAVATLMKDLKIPEEKKAQIYVVRSKIRKAAEAKPIKFLPSAPSVKAEQPEPAWKSAIRDMVATAKEPVAHDPVNHPVHYTMGGIETIDFIEAKELNYRLGNAVKYITRAAHKGNYAEDLKKAVWYIERELERNAKL